MSLVPDAIEARLSRPYDQIVDSTQIICCALGASAGGSRVGRGIWHGLGAGQPPASQDTDSLSFPLNVGTLLVVKNPSPRLISYYYYYYRDLVKGPSLRRISYFCYHGSRG